MGDRAVCGMAGGVSAARTGWTTMSSVSIWTRLGNWLRSSQGSGEESIEIQTESASAHTAEDLTVVNEPEPATVPEDEGTGLSPIGRWHRREQILQRLQEGYERVVELLSAIREHLDSDAEHSRQIDDSICQLSKTVGEWPASHERQRETLEEISKRIQDQCDQQQRLAAAVSEWPAAVGRQTETIDQVREEVRAGQESQSEVASSVGSLKKGLGVLADSARTSNRMFESLERKFDARDKALVDALETQTRKLKTLVGATLALSGLAAVAAIVAVLLHFRSPG